MKRYHYLRLYISRKGGIFFYCTDPQTVNWIVGEVKKIVPTCSLDSPLTTHNKISQLQDKDGEIGYWLVQMLCLKGWEPFAVTSTYKEKFPDYWGDHDVIYFRFEVA
jgi:hypothetical protein